MTIPNTRHQTIQATYRIVTPMFCGGAQQEAEFRLASFKGLLRFWWRALEWGRIQDLTQLRKEEAELFGSSDEGQSSFLMRFNQLPTGNVIDEKSQLKDGNELVGEGSRYLGYGVMEAYERRDRVTKQIKSRAAELSRSCFSAPDTFGLELKFKPGTPDAQQQQIVQAIKLIGLIGGMGCKSRKGYGSVSLAKLSRDTMEDWSIPKSFDDYHLTLGEVLRAAGNDKGKTTSTNNDSAPLTTFTHDFRIVAVEGRNGESPLKLLDRIGREMVRYRSWGRNGKVLGTIDREDGDDFRFRDDHDLMKQDWRSRTTHPGRIAFGLPHNYGKKEQRLDVTTAEPKFDRRASPLFVHIHQAEGSPPIGVLTFLPSMFLPVKRDAISVGGKHVALQTKDFWKPVTNFLDRLLSPSERKEFIASDRVVEVARG